MEDEVATVAEEEEEETRKDGEVMVGRGRG